MQFYFFSRNLLRTSSASLMIVGILFVPSPLSVFSQSLRFPCDSPTPDPTPSDTPDPTPSETPIFNSMLMSDEIETPCPSDTPSPTPEDPIGTNGGVYVFPNPPTPTPTPAETPILRNGPTPTPYVLGASTETGDPANLRKYNLKEGDLIRATGDVDVFILNNQGYKRLYLNPTTLGFHGDRNIWSHVRSVTPEVRDAFPTSNLFRNCEAQDPHVYGIEVTGDDTGILHWVNIPADQALESDPAFFKKVFCFNDEELNWFMHQ